MSSEERGWVKLFLYLQVLDLLSTLIGFSLGNAEASPFIRMLVRWGPVITYRVQLRTMPATACGAATCYEARLLDAAPMDDEPMTARPGLPPQPF